jgi:hypothetical protein
MALAKEANRGQGGGDLPAKNDGAILLRMSRNGNVDVADLGQGSTAEHAEYAR